MSFNEQYYEDKKKKIEERFIRKKDGFLINLFNMVNSVQTELNDIRVEFQEVLKTEEESKKETKIKEETK